ncbi:MAG: hypothetical protein M1125_00275 [Candidatus Marsarchaeota archaeon]|nr:hypothetical protein [Candidatus Marsarchaeota archaeon]
MAHKSVSPMRNMAVFLFLVLLVSGAAHAGTATISPQNVSVDTRSIAHPTITTFTFTGSGVGLLPNESGTPTMAYNIQIKAQTSLGGECFISVTSEKNNQSYAYNLTSNGTLSSGCQDNGFLTFAPLYGPYNITFTTYNDTGNGEEIASANAIYNVNYNLATPTLSLSTNALDVGQSVTMNVNWEYLNYPLPTGTPPFTVKLYSSSTSSCGGSGATLVDSSNDITTYSKSFTVAPTTTGTIYYCAVVTDSSYDSAQTKNSTIMPLYVAATPTIRLSVDYFNYDQGQPATFGFAINNGMGPFDVSLISASNGSEIGNTLTLDSPGSSGSFTFNVPDTTGSYDYYVKVIDEETNNGGTNPYTFESSGSPDSIQYTVNPTLSVPSISLSSSRVEQGQPFSASLSWTGGTEPYTANVYVYNATSNALVTGLTGLGISGISSDTANIPIQSNELMPGTYYLEAAVTDSSGTGSETNSAVSGNFIIAAGPEITETLSSNSLTYPNYPTINLQVANGISPYSVTINIVNQATGSVVESNSISLTAANNIASYPTNVLAPGSYFANVILTDSASPAVTVYSSNAFLISKISPILALDVPSSFTYNGANATVTASVYPLGLTGNLIMSVNGGTGVDVAALTSTSNTLTYNAPASAGSYSFTLATDANSIYGAGTTTANYIISQYNPQPSISVLPSDSFAYDGSNAIINYSLTTYYSNTIGMNLYVNNALVQSSTENLVNVQLKNISIGSYYGYYGAAVSQNGTYLYAPSYYDNLISIVDTKTGAIVKNVSTNLLNGPTGIVIPNNTGNAYITNYLNGTLAVFNLSTGTVEKDIPLSANSLMLSSIKPYYIAASPNGKLLYITDSGTANISVVSTSTDTVIKTVQLQGASGPYSIALSQNGNTIYVGSETSSLYLINTSTYAVTTVSLYPYLTHAGSEMAFVGSNLYIPAYEGSTGVVIYNTTTGAVSGVSGIPDGMIAISELGGYLYISNDYTSSITYVVNGYSGSLIGSIHTGSYEAKYSIAVGSNIYLINYEYNITELKNINIIKDTSAPAKFNFYYTGPAAAGTYSLKAVPVISGNYVTSNAVSTLTISPVPLKALSALPSNSVYDGANFTVTEYNSNAMKLGLSATLNGNIIAKVPSLQPNGITTLDFYAGAESKNGTAYFTTDSNTVYYYPPDSTFGNDIIYLPGGFESYGIAISNATDYAYISQYEGNTIQVFDLATNTLLNSIMLPYSESEIYYDLLSKNDSVLYVSNYGTNSIDAINLVTNAITQIGLGSDSYPEYMVLSPSGRHLYVSGYYDNVSVINTTTDALQYKITTPTNDYTGEMSVSSNGEYLYIPVYDSEYVEMYNTITRSPVKYISIYYPYISAVSGGNAYLFSYYPYYKGYDGAYAYGVTVLNTTTNTQVFGLQGVPFYEDPYYAFTGKNGTVYLIGPYGYESEPNNYTIVAINPIKPETEYSLPAAAGAYTLDFQTTDSNYTGIGVANDIYTISKATPDMHLSGIAPSFIYSGNSINATATFSISNTMQPLSGTLTLNGNVIATYAANALGHVQTVPINAISLGNYVLEFETTGNANYTSANVMESFVISGAAAHTSISVPHSFAYNGSNAIITASISPSNAIGNLYMSVDSGNYVKVDSTTYSSNAITFNAPAVAGNYSFEFYNTANVLYGEGFSIGNYSIYKATPTMSFPQSCSSYTVDGFSCNTIASIDTYNSQITARLYVNGTLVGSTSNTITYTGSNAINTYYIVFNTTGNENYSAYSISYPYNIHSPSSGSSSSTSTTTTVTTTAPYSTIPPTSVVTTTIPQRILNISPSDNSYSGNFGISNKAPYNISFNNEGIFIKFVSKSNSTVKANFTISNYTKTLPYFPGHILYKALMLNFTSNATITANITMHYNCSSHYAVAPYIFRNGTPVEITNYTVYPLSCTINFEVSSDPIIALYENATNKVAPVTTTIPTTIPQKVPSSNSTIGILVVLIIIIIAAVVTYAFKGNKKKR